MGQDTTVTADFSSAPGTLLSAGCTAAPAADRDHPGARTAAAAPSGGTQSWTIGIDGFICGGNPQITGLVPPPLGNVTTQNGGSQYLKPPSGQGFAPITIKTIAGTPADVALSQWVQETIANTALRKDVTLTGLDPTGNPFVEYFLGNAVISQIGCGFNAGSQSFCVNTYNVVYTTLTVQQPSAPVTSPSTATVLGGSTVLTLTCTSTNPCGGTAKLAVVGGPAHDARVKPPRPLGSIRFRIKPHHKATLRIRLNAYGLKQLNLSPGHRLAAELIIHPAGTPGWDATTRRIELVERTRPGHR